MRQRDFEKATALYSKSDLSFLPTLSSEFIRDPPSAKRYFADFVLKLPVGQITDDKIQCLDDDTYLHTGMYTFMTSQHGERVPVQARFTYMWRRAKAPGKWKIVHHHSSEVPGVKADLYSIAQDNFQK